jgi:hypothetical protein
MAYATYGTLKTVVVCELFEVLYLAGIAYSGVHFLHFVTKPPINVKKKKQS